MKNLNKVLAMVVVFVMMISTVAFASSFTDVADTASYSTAIEVGVDLGLIKGYTDGTFAPEGEITRAEFAAIIVRLLGQEAQAEGAKASTQFIDVPVDHWAAGYVNIAVQAKVINGYGNGNFGPDDLVEYQDAITMMVRALGYEPAVGTAGYPTGYLTKAGELGLTSNVNGTNGVAINRGTVAQIAFNALDTPIMTQSGYGTFTQFVVNDGYSSTGGGNNVRKTLLSENHDIVRITGIINNSKDAASTSTVSKDTVSVDVQPASYTYSMNFGDNVSGTENMAIGTSDALDYVGKKCIIFVEYDEFNDECTVKSLYEVKNSDNMILDFADIEKYTVPVADTTDGVIEYAISETKTTEVTIDKNAKVYYNGIEIAKVDSWAPNNDTNAAALIKKSGNIELALLGFDVEAADGKQTTKCDYDAIYITAYDVVVVEEVKASAGRLIAKAHSSLDNDLSKFYYEGDGDVKATLVDGDGAEIEWTDLEENDVIIVKYVDVENGKKIYDAQLATNTVTGTVSEIDNSSTDAEDWFEQTNGYEYVVIDGTEYKVLNCAVDGGDNEIEVGDEGTYYITDSGIVWHEATVAMNENYGYVIKATNADDMDRAEMKILTKDNGIVILNVANKIYVSDFDGTKYDRSSSKLSVVGGAEFDLTSLDNTLITYKVDAADTVTAIELPYVKGEGGTDGIDKYYEKYFSTISSSVSDVVSYDPDDKSFKTDYGSLSITENTVIFDATDSDKDEWEVVSLANLAEDDSLEDVLMYNVDEDKETIGAIVILGAANISGQTNASLFVTAVSKARDEDGVLVNYVKGYTNGELVTYVSEDETATVGTLVIPKFKGNGEVDQFIPVNTEYSNGTPTGNNYAVGYYGVGDSQKTKKNRVTVSLYEWDDTDEVYEDSSDDKTFKIENATNVYVYDLDSTDRVKFELDAYGYVDYDEDEGVDPYWFAGDYEYDTVEVYVYEYDGDVVDVLYVISGKHTDKIEDER